MANRNTTLGYILIGINNAFFWYAPWLLFLYHFIKIEQVALLQVIGLIVRVTAEVPTGALADLLGKKHTLNLAFLLTAIGEIIMAFSRSMPYFILSYCVVQLGYSFYSGTMDAFMYDTLASEKNEKEYPKVLSRSNAVLNFATGLATISGSFLYGIWIGLPFFLTGMTKLIGFLISFFIDEPKVDTYKFSLTNFIRQTGMGFRHLLNREIIRYTLLILIYGTFSAISLEVLDDMAVVDWGYNAIGIGILYSALIFLSIPFSFMYEKIRPRVSPWSMLIAAIVLLALNYLFSAWTTFYVWTAIFFIRVLYSPIKSAAITDILNSHTASRLRATTLSTMELLNKLPFVILGGYFGYLMQTYGIRVFSSYFGALLLVFLAIYILLFGLKPGNKTILAVKYAEVDP